MGIAFPHLVETVTGPMGPAGPKGDTGNAGAVGATGASLLPGLVSIASAVGPVTTSETQIVSQTLAANDLKVGTIYRIVLAGRTTNGIAVGTITAKARIGASGALSEAIAASVACGTRGLSATDVPFRCALDIVCRSVGSSGTVIGSGEIATPTLIFTTDIAGVTSPVNVNTTASRVLQGTLVCTGIGVGVTVDLAYVEKVYTP